jgi:tetratricopeptide (TPR) repeat protein
MTFEELLDQAIAMLQRRGRLTYGALKRQFQLDDAYLEDLKAELIEGQRIAMDENGRVLVWTGAAVSAPHPPAPTGSSQDCLPLAYTPPYLAVKILTSRSALEGERKQVTVLFADLKGSTELIASLDPEAARRLPDPALHTISRGEAYYSASRLSLQQGDFPTAISILERGLEVCQAANIRLCVPMLASELGAAYALAGRLPEALLLLEQAMAQGTAIGRVSHVSLWIMQLSMGYLLAGRLEDALPLAQRALARTRTHGEQGYQAHALRLLGDIHTQCQPPDVEPAETHYREALALAEELGMRPLTAHCRLGLGTLYSKIGRQEQARTALTTAIDLYRAMDMTFWLPQAEAALAQVEGR